MGNLVEDSASMLAGYALRNINQPYRDDGLNDSFRVVFQITADHNSVSDTSCSRFGQINCYRKNQANTVGKENTNAESK